MGTGNFDRALDLLRTIFHFSQTRPQNAGQWYILLLTEVPGRLELSALPSTGYTAHEPCWKQMFAAQEGQTLEEYR